MAVDVSQGRPGRALECDLVGTWNLARACAVREISYWMVIHWISGRIQVSEVNVRSRMFRTEPAFPVESVGAAMDLLAKSRRVGRAPVSRCHKRTSDYSAKVFGLGSLAYYCPAFNIPHGTLHIFDELRFVLSSAGSPGSPWTRAVTASDRLGAAHLGWLSPGTLPRQRAGNLHRQMVDSLGCWPHFARLPGVLWRFPRNGCSGMNPSLKLCCRRGSC